MLVISKALELFDGYNVYLKKQCKYTGLEVFDGCEFDVVYETAPHSDDDLMMICIYMKN
jgi:hypothetical protein